MLLRISGSRVKCPTSLLFPHSASPVVGRGPRQCRRRWPPLSFFVLTGSHYRLYASLPHCHLKFIHMSSSPATLGCFHLKSRLSHAGLRLMETCSVWSAVSQCLASSSLLASHLPSKRKSVQLATYLSLTGNLSFSPVAPTAGHGQPRAAREVLSFNKSLSLWTALSAPRVIVPVKIPYPTICCLSLLFVRLQLVLGTR